MSTEIETKMTEHLATEFWGGPDRGKCLQVTATKPIHPLEGEGFIQLTMEEAASLCNTLGGFVRREAQRRQALLRAEIVRWQSAERTVFNEVSELPDDLMAGPELAVMMVSKFCPKAAREES